jgi:hypothetical protein
MTARIAALVLVVFVSGCGNYKKEEYIIGYRGPARTNPFLAAERFLAELGCAVERIETLDFRRTSGGVLVTNPAAFMNHGDAKAAMNWVGRGGHLVLFLSGSEKWRGDFGEFALDEFVKLLKKEDMAEESKLLLEALGLDLASRGVNVGDDSDAEDSLTISGRRLTGVLPCGLKFERQPHGDVRSSGALPALESFVRGEGRVTVLANAHPFRNRWLAESDHATLLWSIVQLGGDRRVWFCDGARVSFFAMLWEHGWMAIVAVAILIAAWLWKGLPRFGPLQTVGEESARDFTTHLELTGAFLWRHHEARTLLAPTQRAVTAAIQRAGWHPTTPDFFEKVAARAGISIERARDALTLNDTSEPQRFQRLIHDLQIIREKF